MKNVKDTCLYFYIKWKRIQQRQTTYITRFDIKRKYNWHVCRLNVSWLRNI